MKGKEDEWVSEREREKSDWCIWGQKSTLPWAVLDSLGTNFLPWANGHQQRISTKEIFSRANLWSWRRCDAGLVYKRRLESTEVVRNIASGSSEIIRRYFMDKDFAIRSIEYPNHYRFKERSLAKLVNLKKMLEKRYEHSESKNYFIDNNINKRRKWLKIAEMK